MPEFTLHQQWAYARIRFIAPILGTAQANEDVYRKYIGAKAPDPDVAEAQAQDLPEGESPEERGWTTFLCEGGQGENEQFLHPYLPSYQIKGYLKGKGNETKNQAKVRALSSKIEKNVYIHPDKIHFLDDELDSVEFPDGITSRSLNANTPQGKRTSIATSHHIDRGRHLAFWVCVNMELPKELDLLTVKSLLKFGIFSGLGQWRSSGKGRFKLEKFQEVDMPEDWQSIMELARMDEQVPMLDEGSKA